MIAQQFDNILRGLNGRWWKQVFDRRNDEKQLD